MQTWLTEAIILSVLTGVGGYFAARRKNKAEAKGLEIGNKKSEVEASDLVTSVLEKNVEMLNKKIIESLVAMEKLHSENLQLRQEVYLLRKEILQLKNESKSNPTASDRKP